MDILESGLTPALLWDIWRKNYDVYIKCINGRFALPITFLITQLRKKPFVELWRLVINEAFNQGVPAIATDAAGAVAGGLVDQTGLVVTERDSIALAKAIKARLSDQELRIRLGQNAKHRIEYLNFEHMVQSFNQAIEHVTSRQAF